jgi:DNA-binding response OmpR family regulator
MSSVLCIGNKAVVSRYLVLHSAGFNTLIATNKLASLAVCRSIKVDAVLLDSRSCVADISHLASELKSVRPDIPIVLITDSGFEGPKSGVDRIVCRLDGPVALLGALNELIVRAALARSRGHAA